MLAPAASHYAVQYMGTTYAYLPQGLKSRPTAWARSTWREKRRTARPHPRTSHKHTPSPTAAVKKRLNESGGAAACADPAFRRIRCTGRALETEEPLMQRLTPRKQVRFATHPLATILDVTYHIAPCDNREACSTINTDTWASAIVCTVLATLKSITHSDRSVPALIARYE